VHGQHLPRNAGPGPGGRLCDARRPLREIAARNDELDHLYNQIFRELRSDILGAPGTTSRALYLLFSAHKLEPIGDRVVNIAERVIFMVNGELGELSAGPEAPEGYDDLPPASRPAGGPAPD